MRTTNKGNRFFSVRTHPKSKQSLLIAIYYAGRCIGVVPSFGLAGLGNLAMHSPTLLHMRSCGISSSCK